MGEVVLYEEIAGSGPMRVTSPEALAVALAREEPEPLEGTRMDLFNSILPSFYAEQGLFSYADTGFLGNAQLADRTWVSNRCIQLNAQRAADRLHAIPLRLERSRRRTRACVGVGA
jgi:hypothetical protein